MRKEDCLLDTIVALNATTAPLHRGKVVGFGASGIVIVEWSSGSISKASMHNLLTEQEADIKEAELLAKEAELLAKEAELNREFNEASKQIKDKLATASNLIIEASKLSMYDECRPLMQALDKAGWSTSSRSC